MPPSTTKLLVLDLETTMRCTREGYSSSFPFDPDNRILCGCAMVYDGVTTDVYSLTNGTDWFESLRKLIHIADRERPVLVGHNIKYDLTYLRRWCGSLYESLKNLPVWDTQIAEYILSGQLDLFPSLDDCARNWLVGTDENDKKDPLIKRLVEEGKTTEDVSPTLLYDYCETDTHLTLRVALEQMRSAREQDPRLINLIMMHSTVTQVLTEMESVGMIYDPTRATDESNKILIEMAGIKAKIIPFLWDILYAATADSDFATDVTNNHLDTFIGSNDFWSSCFFGGGYTFKWKEAGDPWKSGPNKGKPRYTHKTRDVLLPQKYDAKMFGSERTKTRSWTMDDAVLSKLSGHTVLAALLREYRKLNKLMNTYFQSFPKHLFEGVLHPSIHQTSTHTGRLSQSKPNLQNVASELRVKRCFVPHDPDSCFIEADYKQLELNIFAYQCRDPRLLEDLRIGVDVHGYIGSQLYGTAYNTDLRRKVKGVVFGMIYGGGANTLSEQVGLSVEEVKKVISTFYKRYSTVKHYRESIQDEVSRMTHDGIGTRLIGDKLYHMLRSDTGRQYGILMNKMVTPSGIDWQPSYTMLCNYPIQGLATGDIVPMMLLDIWQAIRREQRPITMVNTVHDSILFEVPTCDVNNQMDWIKKRLEDAPKIFEHWFDKPLDIDLPVSVKYSKESWAGPWVDWTPF